MPLVGDGFVVATVTYFNEDGSVNLDVIPAIVDRLKKDGAKGVFVNGTTGEGPSLSMDERKTIVEAYSRVIEAPFLLFVHVGCGCVLDAVELARHAAANGANAIASICPSFLAPRSGEDVAKVLAPVVDATDLPFYYYHIPICTGLTVSPSEILKAMDSDKLCGIKFSNLDMVELRRCVKFCGSSREVLFGSDSAMSAAFALGVRGAVGSSYHFSIGRFTKDLERIRNGDVVAGEEMADWSIEHHDILTSCGGDKYMSAVKLIMKKRMGMDDLLTKSRPPLGSLTREQETQILEKFEL